ncbi:MAG: HesB/IscA family protein [Gemmatimonadota bacterium]
MSEAKTTFQMKVTEKAIAEVQRYISESNLPAERTGLRVSVLPGGCSGFSYGLDLEPEGREDDEVLQMNGLCLYVDPFSAQYLQGVEIDYVSSFQGSGFTFKNPNATGGCGCGSSFTV